MLSFEFSEIEYVFASKYVAWVSIGHLAFSFAAPIHEHTHAYFLVVSGSDCGYSCVLISNSMLHRPTKASMFHEIRNGTLQSIACSQLATRRHWNYDIMIYYTIYPKCLSQFPILKSIKFYRIEENNLEAKLMAILQKKIPDFRSRTQICYIYFVLRLCYFFLTLVVIWFSTYADVIESKRDENFGVFFKFYCTKL